MRPRGRGRARVQECWSGSPLPEAHVTVHYAIDKPDSMGTSPLSATPRLRGTLPEAMQLRQLTQDDESAFFEGLEHWPADDRRWYTFAWKPGVSYAEMLEALAREHRGEVPEGRVPATMFYGFVDGRIVGRVHVRHALTEQLRRRGGHMGYAVAEKFRRRGYASEMMRQALPRCSDLGIRELLITCADDNIPSWKVIEKYGGLLDDRVWDDVDQEMIRRYRIVLM